MDSSYTWSNTKCVRFHKHIKGEEHPCYYCGIPIPIGVGMEICSKCGFAICPSCKGCVCSQPNYIQLCLRRLRDKFCCNHRNFRLGTQLAGDEIDRLDLLRVPHFQNALDYCREKEGVA